MNNLPLQPLVWTTESDTPSAKSPLHYYDIIREYSCGESCFVRYQKVEAGCNIKQATGFSSFDEAKAWAWKHYNEKMQPYVKPMPTWIDASEQLPSHHQDVIVYRYDGERPSIEHSLYFDGQVMVGFGNVSDEEGFFDDVYYWQPIETKDLYEAMAMQLQISEVGND